MEDVIGIKFFEKPLKNIVFVGYFLIVSIKECVKILYKQSNFWKNVIVIGELYMVHLTHQYKKKDKKKDGGVNYKLSSYVDLTIN